MKEILVGTIAGIFSGIGMGGGTVLIFLLNIFLGIEQHVSQATNLIYFIPTAISAIFVNYKEKNIDIKLAKTISFYGVIGAIVGAIISVKLDVKKLRKFYGFFLLVIGIYEIYTLMKRYKKHRNRNTKYS
jgi:uncharacterized membrane protein YfcA